MISIPAFSQDDGDGGFNVNDLFGSDAFGGQPVREHWPDVLAGVRNSLQRAKAPALDKKQEKPLKQVYDKEVKALNKAFEKQFGTDLSTALGGQSSGRGRRGGGARPVTRQAAEVRRLSDQLTNKVIAALRMDQQAALRRFESEQLRVQRLNQIMQSMEAAGLPLTAEQKIQVEDLYARESRLRTLIVVEAQGQPHATKVAQLEAQTGQRIAQVMNPSQQTALAEALARSRAR